MGELQDTSGSTKVIVKLHDIISLVVTWVKTVHRNFGVFGQHIRIVAREWPYYSSISLDPMAFNCGMYFPR